MASRISRVAFPIGLLLMGASVWVATPAASQDATKAGQDSARVVTFHKDVLPVLQKNCQSCHRPGQIGPFSMLTYKDARPWAKAIKAAVVSRKMPPWLADPRYGHFDNDRSLKQAEIDTIAAWVDSGAPEGDPKNAPAPSEWPVGGWQIQPDLTVELPPYPVPARGVKEWELIAFPAPFKEDTWVTSAELLPGAPAVVHHMCYGFQTHQPTTPYNQYEWMEVPRDEDGVTRTHDGTGSPREGTVVTRAVGSTEEKRRQGRLAIQDINQFCYLPGLSYEDYRPVNAGFFVPAGSDITVSLHYTTTGLAVIDRSRIGFTVAKVRPPKRVVSQVGEGEDSRVQQGQAPQPSPNRELAIPPYEGDYAGPLMVTTFPRDIELLRLRPHAHVRGKSVQYTLIYPDGREEILLNVPRYDFNWQLTYRTSLKIPKGSRIEVRFRYDNSTSNKSNPDASKWVYYGGQSWEEMGTPFMGFLIPSSADEKDFIR